MHVTIVQYDITWEDKAASQETMDSMLAEHPPVEGGLVLLPELGDVGFSFNIDRICDDASITWATRTARRYGCWVQHGHVERADDGRGLNTATLVAPDGTIAGSYRKIHPFSYGGEASHYAAGDRLLLRNVEGACLCPFICYDLRFPEAWRLARRAGAEIFTIGASWPAERTAHWRALLIARAIENQSFVLACNRTGSDPHLSYAGNSMIISPRGEVIAEADDSSVVLQARIDLEEVRSWRDTMRCQDDVVEGFLGGIEVDSDPAP